MDAVNTSLLCGIANSSGNFVLKAGDSMTGDLLFITGASMRSGLPATSDTGSPQISFFASSGTCEILSRYSNDSSGPSILALKTRSVDTTANVISQASDDIFFMTVFGSDGVAYKESAKITLGLDALAPGINDMPGRMMFNTTLDGSSLSTVRLTINSTGLMFSPMSITSNNLTVIPAGGTSGIGYMFSSTANFGMFFGSGIPALSAAQGSWYSRSDGSGTTDRAYINTDGAVGWTAVTTVA